MVSTPFSRLQVTFAPHFPPDASASVRPSVSPSSSSAPKNPSSSVIISVESPDEKSDKSNSPLLSFNSRSGSDSVQEASGVELIWLSFSEEFSFSFGSGTASGVSLSIDPSSVSFPASVFSFTCSRSPFVLLSSNPELFS